MKKEKLPRFKCPWCKTNLIYEEHAYYSNSGTKQHKEYKFVCPMLDFDTRYYHSLNCLISAFKRTQIWYKKPKKIIQLPVDTYNNILGE